MCSKLQDRLDQDHYRAFSILWRTQAPTRIKSFGWRIFLNRVATKDQLKKRDLCLSDSDGNCVMCSQSAEDLNHLLFICSFSSNVWELVGAQSGCFVSFASTSWKHYVSQCGLPKSPGSMVNKGLIWLSVVWSLQKVMNEIVFNNDKCNLNDFLWSIKLLAWNDRAQEKFLTPILMFTTLAWFRLLRSVNVG